MYVSAVAETQDVRRPRRLKRGRAERIVAALLGSSQVYQKVRQEAEFQRRQRITQGAVNVEEIAASLGTFAEDTRACAEVLRPLFRNLRRLIR